MSSIITFNRKTYPKVKGVSFLEHDSMISILDKRSQIISRVTYDKYKTSIILMRGNEKWTWEIREDNSIVLSSYTNKDNTITLHKDDIFEVINDNKYVYVSGFDIVEIPEDEMQIHNENLQFALSLLNGNL